VTRPASLARLAARALALCCCCALLALPGAGFAQARDKEGKEGDKKEQAKSLGLSKRVADKLSAANEFLQVDNLDGALGVIDDLAKRRGLSPPEIAQIHRFRGYIMVGKGKTEEAVKEFEISLEQQALDAVAEKQMIYSLAQIYTQLGKFDKALQLINTWFEGEENPKPDAYYLKAMILVQQEKFKQAVEPAKKAVELADKPRESWVQLQVAIYSSLQDYANVADALERLISISPGKKQYWVQLAAVQNVLERESKALAAMRLAKQAGLLTDDREYRQLARLLFLRDLPYQCAKTIEEGLATKVVKEDAESYRLMSNCYLAARESEKALGPLAKAGELATDGEMYMLLGQMHLQRDRFEPALDALHKALAKAKPTQRGAVQLMIGVAELGTNDLDAAERSFRAAHGDAKVRNAAESYLKYLSDQRARLQLQQQQAAEPASAQG
jgi:tetratricopeptide (TPR) repeat protein